MNSVHSFASLILMGFGAYSILFVIVGFFLSPSRREKWNAFDRSTVLLAAIIGLLYLVNWGVSCFVLSLSDGIFGPYWFGIWLPIALVGFSQLLWFPTLRTNAWIRLLVGFCLIVSIEGIVTSITSLHRDYLPSSWSKTISHNLIAWIKALILFVVLATVFHFIHSRREKSGPEK